MLVSQVTVLLIIFGGKPDATAREQGRNSKNKNAPCWMSSQHARRPVTAYRDTNCGADFRPAHAYGIPSHSKNGRSTPYPNGKYGPGTRAKITGLRATVVSCYVQVVQLELFYILLCMYKSYRM